LHFPMPVDSSPQSVSVYQAYFVAWCLLLLKNLVLKVRF
jgi:hypothetical protein